jgi:hypothetical protein
VANDCVFPNMRPMIVLCNALVKSTYYVACRLCIMLGTCCVVCVGSELGCSAAVILVHLLHYFGQIFCSFGVSFAALFWVDVQQFIGLCCCTFLG